MCELIDIAAVDTNKKYFQHVKLQGDMHPAAVHYVCYCI